jgi:hypothetical protein
MVHAGRSNASKRNRSAEIRGWVPSRSMTYAPLILDQSVICHVSVFKIPTVDHQSDDRLWVPVRVGARFNLCRPYPIA